MIVGSGPLEDFLRAETQRLGLGAAVTFVGLQEDVATYYAAADVVVLLSRTEATPRVLLEAMRAGAPIVATDVGDVARLLGQGTWGALVPSGDIDAAVAAIRRSLLHGRDGSDAAREHVRCHYGLAAMAAAVDDFYASVLNFAGVGEGDQSQCPEVPGGV